MTWFEVLLVIGAFAGGVVTGWFWRAGNEIRDRLR